MQPPPLQPDDHLPRALQSDLTALHGHGPKIPAHVDQIILTTITRRMAHLRRMRVLLRWGAGAAAAAAILLVAVHLWPAGAPQYHAGSSVTILDAFALARQIKAGGKIDRSWDINHDGVIDQHDVDALAQRAVQLSPGGKGSPQ